MEKNSKYTFRCNDKLKEDFQVFCKVGGVSPSDVLQTVMLEFNEMAQKVMAMKDVTELRDLLQSSINRANEEMDELVLRTDPGSLLPKSPKDQQ